MTGVDVLLDGFNRIQTVVNAVMRGITKEELSTRLDPDANSVSWLIWHLTRVQDDHVSDAAGTQQAWFANGWCDRFALAVDPHSIGYGHTSEEVGQLSGAPAEFLQAYFDDVHAATIDFVSSLEDDDLDRVVDAAWDPPVTLGVRLVSVISDDLQHAGQAAIIRGIVARSV